LAEPWASLLGSEPRVRLASLFHPIIRRRVRGRRYFRTRPPFILRRFFLGAAKNFFGPKRRLSTSAIRTTSGHVPGRRSSMGREPQFFPPSFATFPHGKRAPKVRARGDPFRFAPSPVCPACAGLSATMRARNGHAKWLGSLWAERPSEGCCMMRTLSGSTGVRRSSYRAVRMPLLGRLSSTRRHQCSLPCGFGEPPEAREPT